MKIKKCNRNVVAATLPAEYTSVLTYHRVALSTHEESDVNQNKESSLESPGCTLRTHVRRNHATVGHKETGCSRRTPKISENFQTKTSKKTKEYWRLRRMGGKPLYLLG